MKNIYKCMAYLMCVILLISMLPISTVKADDAEANGVTCPDTIKDEGIVSGGETGADSETAMSDTAERIPQSMNAYPWTDELPLDLCTRITVENAVGTVTYTSSNPEILRVDSTGWLSANASKGGDVVITVSASGDAAYLPARVEFIVHVLEIIFIDSEFFDEDGIWSLYSDGLLMVEGTGSKCLTYSQGGSYVWSRVNDQVEKVVIENGIEGIEDYGLAGGNGSRESVSPIRIELADSVKSVGRYAFYRSNRLETVVFGSGIESIGRYSFTFCPNLKEIVVPEDNNSFCIVDGALYSKDITTLYKVPPVGYSEFSVQDGTVNIEPDALGDNLNLKSVSIPATVMNIYSEAFDGSTNLTDVYYSGSKQDWNTIAIGSGNEALKNANIHFSRLSSLDDCNVSLDKTSFTFTGKDIMPLVTVTDGDEVLTAGSDYTVSYKDNINAGTAAVLISGTGDYSGSLSATFTINKAAARLQFDSTEISKKISDSAFTNELTVQSDGLISFESSDENVATVNSNGLVTIKGEGNTIITASAAAGQNYLAASANYVLTVSADKEADTHDDQDSATDKDPQNESADKETDDRNDGAYTVGDDVTADFNTTTGAVVLYSKGGTLWEDWISRSGLSADKIKSIKLDDISDKVYLPTDLSSMFYGCTELETLDLRGFDSSQTTDISGMFCYCRSLKKLDLTGFNTSNVIAMENVFADCSSLTTVNLSSFDTSKVTNMYGLFAGCSSLIQLDLSGFDTRMVAYMLNMFNGCTKLTKINLTGFDVSNVEFFDNMFRNCSSLTALDLSSFDMSKATDMGGMLEGCVSLQTLKTPKINNYSEDLPFAMYDSAGKKYTTLPITTNSILLTKNQGQAAETEKTDISNVSITKVNKSYIYSRKKIKPVPAVNLNGKTLKKNQDYTLEYADNVKPGLATIIITGMGEYTGSVEKTFLILPKDAKISSVKNKSKGILIEWGKCSYASGYYVYRDGERIASVNNKTFTYTDKSAKNGKKYAYRVCAYKTINGSKKRGGYTNTIKTVRVASPMITSAKNSASRKIMVTWKKNSKATGYQVRYVLGSTKKTYTITSGKTVSKVLSGLKKGKTYKVYVRSYKTVGGKKYYSAWSSAKKVKIKK